MKTELIWKEGMHFSARAGGNTIETDAKAPLGKETGMTPKELVAVGMGGCTAMDVVALLKKHKQSYDNFSVEVDITPTSGKHPIVFEKAVITFRANGTLDKKIMLDSVIASQTKFCGVNAMISKATPIEYIVIVNNEEIGRGMAQFDEVE